VNTGLQFPPHNLRGNRQGCPLATPRHPLGSRQHSLLGNLRGSRLRNHHGSRLGSPQQNLRLNLRHCQLANRPVLQQPIAIQANIGQVNCLRLKADYATFVELEGTQTRTK